MHAARIFLSLHRQCMHELPKDARAASARDASRASEIQTFDGRHRFLNLPYDPGNRLQTSLLASSVDEGTKKHRSDRWGIGERVVYLRLKQLHFPVSSLDQFTCYRWASVSVRRGAIVPLENIGGLSSDIHGSTCHACACRTLYMTVRAVGSSLNVAFADAFKFVA